MTEDPDMTRDDDPTEYVELRPSASAGPSDAPAVGAAVAGPSPTTHPPSPPPPSPPPPAAPPPVAPFAASPSPNRGPTTVTELKSGPGLAVRALWFLFVGWWLTGIASVVAWVAMLTLIGLPLGIWLINRIPTVLTLRPRTSYRYEYTDELGRLVRVEAPIEQPPWYVRGVWFVFVGWWASGLAMAVGWLLIVLIVTMPIGLMIYNRVPFVASLVRY